MRLRYKILIVVACFVTFYAGIGPASHACFDPDSDCHFAAILWIMTRIHVPAGPDEGIAEYRGTAQGIEEPSMERYVLKNIPFFLIMIVGPACVICGLILHEKRAL